LQNCTEPPDILLHSHHPKKQSGLAINTPPVLPEINHPCVSLVHN